MKLAIIITTILTATKSLNALSPPENRYRVFEKLDGVPYPWILRDNQNVDPNQPFKLRIHLRNSNMASFQQRVMDLSTPSHPTYGRHMTQEEVTNYLAPPSKSFQLVREWLEYNDAGNITIQNDWFIVKSTIGKLNKLLNTKYNIYENSETGMLVVRTLSYSLPQFLHAHVDIVAPTIKFSTPITHRSTLVDWPVDKEVTSVKADILDGGVSAACNTSITLDCLKDLYKLRDYSGSNNPENQFALAGFLEQYAQHDDLQTFLKAYEPAAVGSDFSTVLVNGGLNTQQNTVDTIVEMGEANLDIQYAFLAYPTPSVYISTGGRPPETPSKEVDNEPYLEFLTYLLNSKKVPQTVSISYGDSEWTVPNSYAHTVCDLFSQLAARGVSVIVSSGDSGSGSSCNETQPGTPLYTPSFPASCPFVTSVGATYHIAPEIAVEFSGGGFSDLFSRPEYQDAAVSSYLQSADPAFKSFYNTSGRAYPDISAQGVNFHVFVRGEDALESGTSASAPVVAAIFALINGDRIDRGLAPLGLLNPWLYSVGNQAFNDITEGKSSGCPQVPGSGFPATEGWDPVTGFGTPDFSRLREVSMEAAN